MCIGKGMIAVRGKTEPLYLMDSNDHAPIVAKFNLKDEKLIDRDFVRLELLPLGSLTSIRKSEWLVHVDEEGSLPSWFEEEKETWFDRCKTRMVLSVVPDWVKNGVGGSLYLRNTQITSLGSLKSVGGSLYLRNTQIKKIPKGLKVGGEIYQNKEGA